MKLKVAVGILVLAILSFTVFGQRGLLNMVRYKKEKQELVEEAARLKQENQKLRLEIDRLQSDYTYIERLAREELGMVKPEEIVFQFAEAKERPTEKP